ncbi:sensor histidine kinase [Micromonospora sp. SL1-18]|uniref:sensor histidine kinase n=1 Tax=Micromonospora sp. SL1-18 TaxID=3399128 RepID=UPI003A4D6799
MKVPTPTAAIGSGHAPAWPEPLRRVHWAFRAHPWWFDTLLAAGTLLLGQVTWHREPSILHGLGPGAEVPGALVPITIAVQCAALAWRRRAPLTVFTVVLALCLVHWTTGVIPRSDLCLMICLYTLARYAPLRLLPWVGTTTLAALPIAAFRVPQLHQQFWVGLFFLTSAATAGTALGLVARDRQARLAALAERAARAESEREQRERLATLAERARVSREMHDILGHSLAVIVGLADGGEFQIKTNPAAGAQALHIIGDTARQALTELRRTLDALRERPFDGTATAENAELSPQPGVADLDRLLDHVRAAGPQVTYTTAGDLSHLARDLQLAVYRIIQEATTNSIKHAGPRTSVRVAVEATDEEVHLTVTDTGPPDQTPARDGGRAGQGLIGIRERAALAGGGATAGPRPEGGWIVHAILPRAARPSPRPERP